MNSLKTYATILIAMMLWSATFVLVKIGLEEVTPIYLAALRFSIATMILVGFALVQFEIREIEQFTKNNFVTLLALGIVGIPIPNILQNLGMLYVSASMASILQNSSPAFTLILAAIFLRESLGYKKLSGLFISSIGVVIISTNGDFSTIGNGSPLFYGNLMLISSAICYSIYAIIGKKLLENNSPLLILTVSTLMGTVLLNIISILTEPVNFLYSAVTWSAILVLAVICTVIGTLLYFEALKELEASKTGFFALLIPVFAIIQASVLLAETIHPYQIACGALVLLGIWIAQME
ncbi:MAG: DMT family transporter [Methanosarcinales archaeon Met12]|nr:MAG: DMT family transporter [Methanosarcinales archaeon Met12]